MSVLVCLAASPGQPVSKEVLLQKVWPDTFVGEGVLVRSIVELRRVFEDDAKEPRVIQTIARRGYRVIAPVAPSNGSLTLEPSPVTPDATVKGASGHWAAKKLRYGVLALTVVVLVTWFISVSKAGRWWNRASENLHPIRSLAVIPLVNLTGDPGQEYFADGMTEELITELSRSSDLRVVSRTSVMRYKKTDKSLPEIARELNVDGIVEGSVARSGERVRITAQLIEAKTDANLWAETFDRDARDVLALQADVANAIATTVKARTVFTSSLPWKAPHSVNLKAHEACLRGWHENDIGGILSNRRGMQEASQEHYRRAVEYFKEATREDADFAPAYLGLALSAETIEETEGYAKKALQIDNGLSDAHLALGAIELVRDSNWQGAEQELRLAIETNPSNAAAHHGYAYFLDAAGRLDEGMQEWERAQELDPGKDHLAGALYSRRQYDRLIELELDSLAKDPDPGRSPYDSAVTHKTLMVAYARLGKKEESVEEFQKALMAYGYNSLAEDLRRGYAHAGYEGALREWLKGVPKEKPEFPFHWVAAYVHTELGDRDAALAYLRKMEPLFDVPMGQDANVFPNLVTLRIEPMWDPLHSDPRFDELVRKVGFPR
jgi:TolB-like protein